MDFSKFTAILVTVLIVAKVKATFVEIQGDNFETETGLQGDFGVHSFLDSIIGDGGAPTCKKLLLVLAKKMMPILRTCNSELKAKYESNKAEYVKRQHCPMKCFMTRSKMTNGKGQVNNVTMTEFFKIYMPANYYALAYQVTGPCIEEYEGKIDNDDEYCKDQGEFIRCIQIHAAEHCAN